MITILVVFIATGCELVAAALFSNRLPLSSKIRDAGKVETDAVIICSKQWLNPVSVWATKSERTGKTK